MGCISACFGHCSNRYKKIGKHEVLDQKIESTKESQIATDHLKSCFSMQREREDNNEDQLNSSARKSIGFNDLNLIFHEAEAAACVSQIEECANQVAAGEKAEGEQGKKNNHLIFHEGDEGKKAANEISNTSKEEEETGKHGRDDEILSDSSESSLFTYPTNYRYKNCAESDDECEVVVSSYEVKERDTGSGRRSPVIEEESSESLFSLSIDSKRQSLTPGIEGDKEVSSSSSFITTSADSVLNSTENLSQCKIVRRKATPSTMKKNQEKENVLELSGRISDLNVIGVDTSLSSWLVESENDPGQDQNNSPSGSVGTSSLKDRAILGELTMDELKQMSRHSSPSRGSPRFNKNPDEKPILGTVGSYWRHTGGGGRQLPMAMDAADKHFLDQVRGSSGHC